MAEEFTGDTALGLLKNIRSGKLFRALRNRDYRLLRIGQVGHSASLWGEALAWSWLMSSAHR